MKKSLLLVVPLIMVISLLLLSCGNQATPTTPAPTTAPVTSAAPKASTPAAVSPSASAPAASPTPSTVAPATAQPTSAASGSQQYGGTMRIIVANSPVYLGDPALINDGGSQVIGCIQSLLFSENSGKQVGVLATDWTIAPDYKSITFKLRKGVKFQDGTDFNATAAKWNMDRYLAAYGKSNAQQWDSIDIIDEYTIKLNLKTFANTILSTIEGSAGFMVSPAAAQKNGIEWLKLNPVGTGPYSLRASAETFRWSSPGLMVTGAGNHIWMESNTW